MKIKTVIFDLDGTLLDTLDDLTDAVNHALCRLGRERIDRSAVRRYVGNGVPKLIERALLHTSADVAANDRDRAACYEYFTEYYNAHSADKTRLYDGVYKMLCDIKARGINTAVVTNKYDKAAQDLRRAFFDCVDITVGTSDDVRPKPSRDGVDKALSYLKTTADSAVYVGDGETDIATALAVGMPIIAVCWGFRDRQMLEELHPDGIIDEPGELLREIDRLERAIK